MSDLNTEILISANAEGVEAGVGRAKKSLSSLGDTAQKIGKNGADGMQALGAGADMSARKVESATKNMVGSLQRQIAAMEAGDKTSRKYQETLARMRGVDVAALKPYLDQLDSLQNKTTLVARAQESLNGVMLKGAAAFAVAGAIAGYVKVINDGVDALNDLKDATGASIENISALEDVGKRAGASFDVVSTSLIKFNNVLSDAKPGSAAEQAITALGLSIEDLKRLDPAEALRQTSVALNRFADDGDKARLVQELFGKSVKEVAPFLKDLAESGALVAKVTTDQAEQAEKFNKELSALGKNAQDASRALVGPMVSALNDVIAKFKEGREAGKSFLEIANSRYWSNIRDFYGMTQPAAPSTGGATGSWGDGPDSKPSVGPLPDTKKPKGPTKAELSEYDKLIQKLGGDLPKAAAEAEAAQMGYNKAQTEFLALAGSPAWASFTNSQRAVVASMFEGKIASEEAGEAAKALSKAYAEAAAERIKTIQSMERAADSLQSQNDALREEIELIGLSTEQQTLVLQQRNDVIILTKEATLAELERQSAITGTQTRVEIALASEIDALKERNALLGAKGVKNAAVDAAKSAADEWQKTSDKINDTLTDALMRGFESGKDFAKNLRDTVVNMFKTMVLRPVISAIVNPVAGAVTGMMGLSGPANASTGVAGQAGSSFLSSAGGSMLGNMGGIGAGFMSGVSETMLGSAFVGPSASAAGGATGMAAQLGAAAPYLAAAVAIYAIAKSLDDSGTYHTGGAAQYSAATGLRTSLGFRDNEEGLPSYNPNDNIDNQFGTGFGYVVRGDQTISAVSGIAQGLSATLDGVAVAFGEKAGYAVATAFADDTSKDGAWGALRISKDGQELLNWQDTRTSRWAPKEFGDGEAGYKEYLAAVAKDTRQVLLDMDLPSWADKMLESIGDSASMEQLTGVLTQIGVVQTTFVQLGKTVEGFAGMTGEAFEALMRASGGFESLAANAGTYYENFYSEAEKTAAVTRSVSDVLAQVGLAMPATRDEFRALVESQLAMGEAGAEAVAALLGVSGAFASVVPAAEQAAEAISQIMQNLLRDRGRLEADLLRAQGNIAGADAANRLLDIAGYTEAETALYDYNAALRAQISGLEAASAASANALQRIREQAEAARQGALDEVDAAYSGLERSVDAQRSLVQETINDTRAVFETLRDNVRSLYGEVGGTAAMQAAQGRAFIGQALSAAQATGYLPDGQQLQEAIGAVRSEMQSKVYASQAEADYERLVLAGELKDLQDLSGDQLTEAEKQLKALDDILDNARAQVDALNGIDTSVISVEAAIQRLADALLTAKRLGLDKSGAASKAGGEYLAQVTPDMLKGYTQDQISGADNWTFGSREAITQAWQGGDYATVADIVRRAGMSQSGLQNTFGLSAADLAYVNSLGIRGVDPTQAVAGHDIALGNGTATNTGQSALFDSLALQAQAALAAGNEAGIYAEAAARGLDSGDINALLGLPEGSAEEWARKTGLPVLRVGTNYVEEDGLHYLHKGEAVIPQPYNPAAGGMGNNNARLEALVEGLTKEVQRLQAVVNDGNREQRRTANAVNGNPDMPMLVQTV